jgi:3-oxoacyl-[acyl-carrier protein] reductase
MSKLEGKVAVITGASKGIGASIAEHLGADGASVVVNYASSKSGADKVVANITAKGGKAIAVQADVSKPEDVQRLFAETKAAYGKVDILVNNAGIYEFGGLDTITPEHFHKQFDLNVLGLLLATQAAVRMMPEGGSILNISSIVGQRPSGMGPVYSATKAGIIGSDFHTNIVAATPLGRIAEVEDIAKVAAFYASDDAGWITGQTLILAGGIRM